MNRPFTQPQKEKQGALFKIIMEYSYYTYNSECTTNVENGCDTRFSSIVQVYIFTYSINIKKNSEIVHPAL